jgi:hypothetical protein
MVLRILPFATGVSAGGFFCPVATMRVAGVFVDDPSPPTATFLAAGCCFLVAIDARDSFFEDIDFLAMVVSVAAEEVSKPGEHGGGRGGQSKQAV